MSPTRRSRKTEGTGESGPRLVSITISSGAHDYLTRLLDLGALEGSSLGTMDVNERVKPLFNAIHHVLAGGEVKITIPKKGTKSTVDKLDKLQRQARKEANAINRRFGFVQAKA